MEDTSNIVNYKHKLDSLTNEILNEYMKLEKSYYLEKQNSVNSLNDISSKNQSICESLQSKTDQINSLELEIDGYKSRENEYKLTINNLQKQIEENQSSKHPETETNKFDMLRSQAKEITAKDNEIIRLTKELVKLKETNDIKQNITMVVEDKIVEDKVVEDKVVEDKVVEDKIVEDKVVEDKISGWSPTSSKTPKPEVNELELNSKEEGGENEEDEEFSIISYRKKKYYKGNEDKVYEILDNEEVGTYIGMWIKQDSGKFKLIKS